MLNTTLAFLTLVSVALLLWQWLVARRFPLHQRNAGHPSGTNGNPTGRVADLPAVTLLKPLKGRDSTTEDCLRSWFTQDYSGEIQILFGVASTDDPVCEIVRKLLSEYPKRDAELVVCGPPAGANAKASKLANLEKLAKYEVLCISDADVRVPPDFLANAVGLLEARHPQTGASAPPVPRTGAEVQDGALAAACPADVGLVSSLYCLGNPATLAMQWEAVAVNADFWSQVLQARSLKPLDFALGAAMVTRRKQLEEIGGFRTLVDCAADDYQLGKRVARNGCRLELSPVVVECRHPPQGWRKVWRHQIRWARTIRVCQPAPYFLSILSNVTLWAFCWFVLGLFSTTVEITALNPGGFDATVSGSVPLGIGVMAALLCCLLRVAIAFDLQRRLTRSSSHAAWLWVVPIKDLLQAVLWLCAFAGNRIEWRGQYFAVRRDGTLKLVS